MNIETTLDENKLMLDGFISTASTKDLQEILDFIKHLRLNNDIKNRTGREEEEELEEGRILQIDTGIDVQGILNSFNDFELSEIENKINSKLQKENTSKEAFDALKE